MKLTALFTLVFSVCSFGHGIGQQLTIHKENASLEQIFKAIEQQSQYHFFYADQDLKMARKVSLKVKNADLVTVLNVCFAGQPLSYSLVANTIMVKYQAEKNAPLNTSRRIDTTVHGTVTNELQQPMAGVSVTIAGKHGGAVTDEMGVFTIRASKLTDTIIFKYVGYQELSRPLNHRTQIQVQLTAKPSSLEELVVVGYGIQKKKNLTGAVDQINGKELQNRPVTNVGDALQGMMANLNVTTNSQGGAPNATKSINVRGYTGFNGSGGSLAGPLILVDGVETDINSVNPTDIESVSLLKDAASSAVYGSRAPNGVLLITTKQGKKNTPAKLSYSDNFSFSEPLNVPQMSSSLVFANTMNEAFTNAGLPPLFTQDAITRITNYINNPKGTPTTIPVPGSDAWANTDPTFANSNNDWFKIYLRKWSPSQQHNFSVDGGNEKITYYVGFGIEDHNGLFNYFNDSYKRNNLRANITADINKYITFSLRSSFAQENDNSPYNGGANTNSNFFHQIPRTWPIYAFIDPNGGIDKASYIPQIEQGGRNISRTNVSNIGGDITIKPLPGWDITGHYNYSYTSYNINSSILPFYYSTPSNPNTLSTTIPSVSENYGLTNYYMYNVFTSYEKHLGGHNFKVLLGEQTEQKTYSNLSGNNQYLYSNNQPSLGLTSGTTPSTTDNGGYSWATNSTIGRINYNYKEKYLIEANASYMGTSLFPVDTRYHLFTSGSAGWNISKEDFFRPLQNWINNLKLRISYGGLGDVSYFLNGNPAQYYPYLSNLVTNSSTNTSWIFNPASGERLPSVSAPTELISPTLTWAKPSELDLGIDVDFLTDFNASFDWYNKKITDQFGPSSTYPGVLGTTPPTVNNAASTTKGWDLTASWKHKFGEVNVTTRATLSHYSGKITQYTGNPQNYRYNPYVGEQLGAIWGFKTVGKFQSQAQINSAPSQAAISSSTLVPGDIQYADLNHDGKITYGSNTVADPGDQTIIGNSTPKFLYGFNLGANWKGVDLSIFIQGQGHADYMPVGNYFWGVTTQYQTMVTPKQADRWAPSNTNGYFPRLDIINGSAKNQLPQSGYLLNAAYTRLKNASLGYTFPNSLTAKLHVYQLRIYGSVENALTFSGVFKHQYADPELLQSNEEIYPLQRTYSFGLQMNIK